MKDSLIYLVTQLLRANKIPFDKEELSFQIQSHPSYPSLHAVTGVLTHFNIENAALQVPQNKEVISQLPSSFIACMNSEKGQVFGVVIKKKDSLITYYSSKNKKKYSQEEFLQQFTGIIVAVEKEESDRPSVQTKNATYLRTGLFAILGFMLIGLLYISHPTTMMLTYIVLSIVGISISIALFKQRLGLHTSIGSALCSDTNISKSCNAVLSSKGATLFGIELSDMSGVYFISLAFSSVLLLLLKQDFTYLYAISVLATPITIYSIYYQYAFAKAWCPLCLIVVVVLMLQASIGIPFLNTILENPIHIKAILIITSSYMGTLILWRYFDSKLIALKRLTQSEIDYTKFKRNFNLFNTLLTTSAQKNTMIDTDSEIIFGTKEAILSIVIITNPFCGYCKPVHTLIEDILKKYKNLVRITIRINVDPNNKDKELYKIATRLLEIHQQEGANSCLSAMRDIYGDMTFANWTSLWGIFTNEEVYRKIIEKQHNWCLKNKINFTPEILINGYSFPSEYQREDLIHFIEDLNDSISKEGMNSFPSQLQQAI